MPMLAQRYTASRAGSKRRRNSCSCAISSTSRKQVKTSNAASPSATKSSRLTQEEDPSKPVFAKSCPSMKDTIGSHINASLNSWLAELKIIPSTRLESQPLDPCATYIYMQLDLDDPDSYVAVPLPPSLVAHITALPSPHSSPAPSTIKEDTDSMAKLSTRLSQIDTKTSSSLLTPPQTPPRMTIQD